MNAANPQRPAKPLPHTIPEYLAQLRAALKGADPALIQDALYDAEEYLRSELADRKGESEAEVIASVAASYGAPDEVAEIYRDTEVKVSRALRPAPPPPRVKTWGNLFGVMVDPRTYAAMLYLLLSLATGIFYFTWVVTGLSLSLGLSVLIVGLPFIVLFFGSVRVISVVEGRIVETLLGERMPRRPLYVEQGLSWTARIIGMFTDPRSWSTLLYMLLMLPLGIVYFTVSVTVLTLALSFVFGPLAAFFGHFDVVFGGYDGPLPFWAAPLLVPLGLALLLGWMHAARGIGRLHGLMAKHLLVRASPK